MIEQVIDKREKDLGGFVVGRVLPYAKRRMVGPFIFFDHMGPADFAPGIGREVDVRPHPHIGLSTVTYLYSGEIMHRDSVGSVQAIRPGEVNWMVAGRGITHSERFEKARALGDQLHGIQAWVALPAEHEETDPAFSHHAGDDLPTWENAGVAGRLIAGRAYGMSASVKTHSPLFYVHLAMASGAAAPLPDGVGERALYVARGAVSVGRTTVTAGQMALLSAGADHIRAEQDSDIMLLGGEPVGERFIDWNFVSSSKERLAQARADWIAGRMKLPDADDGEFIPYPASQPTS